MQQSLMSFPYLVAIHLKELLLALMETSGSRKILVTRLERLLPVVLLQNTQSLLVIVYHRISLLALTETFGLQKLTVTRLERSLPVVPSPNIPFLTLMNLKVS